jgi:DNA-directed RNA polymerase subunit RPC12/RpoP
MAVKNKPKKNWLIYECAHCNKMVVQNPGPYWLDSGTRLICPECKFETVVRLEKTEVKTNG